MSLEIGDFKKIDSTSFTTSYKGSEIHFESTDQSILDTKDEGSGYQMLWAKTKGTVFIKAMKGTTELGRFQLTVSYVPIETMSFRGSSDRIITEMQESSLQVVTAPLNATNMKLAWTVSDPSVVIKSADEGSAVVIGDHPGSAIVTATSADGLKVSCKFTVTALPPYPKSGVDAVVKSYNENILPTLNTESLLLLSKLGDKSGIQEMRVNTYDWGGQLKIIFAVQSATGFYRFPIPTFPIKSFGFNLYTKNTYIPFNEESLSVKVSFSGDNFDATVGTRAQQFSYNQIPEFIKFVSEALQSDVDAIKKKYPTYF